MITIQGDTAVTEFSAFDLSEYSRFLDLKRLPAPELDLSYDWRRDTYTVKFPARYAAQFGMAAKQDLPLLPMATDMWDYQQYFTTWGLKRKRAAFFWDCGLGKTRAFLEFARQAMHLTGRKALIVSIAGNLITQTIKQAQQFYGDSLPILRIETREQLIEWLTTEATEEHRDDGDDKHAGSGPVCRSPEPQPTADDEVSALCRCEHCTTRKRIHKAGSQPKSGLNGHAVFGMISAKLTCLRAASRLETAMMRSTSARCSSR